MQSRMKEKTEKGKIHFHSGVQGRVSEEILTEWGLKRWLEVRTEEMAPQLKES